MDFIRDIIQNFTDSLCSTQLISIIALPIIILFGSIVSIGIIYVAEEN